MNYATSAAGSIQVEIQDSQGQAIPGSELTDPIYGDLIDGPIAWKTDLRRLTGSPIRLHVMLKDADLYSLRFVG